MKIKTNNKKTLLLITASILLVSVGAVSVLAYSIHSNKDNQELSPTTIEDRPVGDINYDTPTSDEANPTLDSPGTTSSDNSSIGVSIPYAGGTPLQVRVLIDEILPEGKCSLVITKATNRITAQTVDVFPASSSTTCKGFTINEPSLEKGTYTATVTVESGDKIGTGTKEFVVQ